MRKLGIACVLERFVQQAVMQVLQKGWEPTFSAHSHGFRPGRSAKQAVHKAQQYIAEGYRWVVDLDLEKFFESSKPRPSVSGGGQARGRQANAQVDASVSGGRSDGRRVGECGG